MSTEMIQDIVNDARATGKPLRIAGRSHWMDAGRPVAAKRVVSTATHSGIVDYVPGDLTITVRSGMSLREISDATASEGQWFPLDPCGNEDGTIGATIATGSSGPLAQRFGGIRDLVLGLEFVAGDGKIVRGGGRVVKNVAGFDLTRLLTGSWGTLGVITEATLRLYSAESQPATFVLSVDDERNALEELLGAIRSAPVTPHALVLVNETAAAKLGLPNGAALLISIGGNAESVLSQSASLLAFGAERPPLGAVQSLRQLDGDGSSTLRISMLPTRLPEVWFKLRSVLDDVEGAMMQASPALGIVRCVIPEGAHAGVIGQLAALCADCTLVYERMPAQMWAVLSPSVVANRLSRGIKTAFDPSNILNPGILGD